MTHNFKFGDTVTTKLFILNDTTIECNYIRDMKHREDCIFCYKDDTILVLRYMPDGYWLLDDWADLGIFDH